MCRCKIIKCGDKRCGCVKLGLLCDKRCNCLNCKNRPAKEEQRNHFRSGKSCSLKNKEPSFKQILIRSASSNPVLKSRENIGKGHITSSLKVKHVKVNLEVSTDLEKEKEIIRAYFAFLEIIRGITENVESTIKLH